MSFTVPRRLGPYEIRARIGAGGMGEVYLAEDTDLKRRVAIKVLTPSLVGDEKAQRRLVREAQAAAALDHPHICAIYAVSEHDGQAFIVMQYVDGETLAARLQRGRLPVAEALDIASAVADGLADAHAHGIVHRDIKPQNVMITARGQAKILDFGLAKVVAPEIAGSEIATRSLLTQAGTIVGTAPYMSPEQVKGAPLDARTDIFSFGVMLYEMLSGRNPFSAGSAAETIAAVLSTEPEPLAAHGVAAPSSLERVLHRCLRKDRSQRYETMREVLLELASARREMDSGMIAVPKSDQRAAGSRAPRTSRFAAVSLALALAAAGYGWYANTPAHPPSTAATSKSAAYDLYLRGRINAGSENRENNEAAIRLLEQAVAADPEFAPALAELARAYHIRAFYFASDAERNALIENAEVAVAKALRLDPKVAEAHHARGLLLWSQAKRFPHEQAVQSFKQAIALNPKLDEAHHQLALVYLHVGLLDKAWAEIDAALAINPANTMARFRYGVIDLYRGRYEPALEILNSTPASVNPSLVAFQKATALFHLGRRAEAAVVVDEYLRDHATDSGGTVTSLKAVLLASAGRRQEADQMIERAIVIGRNFGHFHHTAYNIASAYAILDKPDDSLKWLQLAADDGFPCYPLFEQDATLNNLRKDPRFIAFLAQIKSRWQRYAATL